MRVPLKIETLRNCEIEMPMYSIVTVCPNDGKLVYLGWDDLTHEISGTDTSHPLHTCWETNFRKRQMEK